MGLISLVKTIKLHIFIGAFATGILTSGIVLPAKAQVTSDGTTNTIVNSSGNNFIIINGIERGHNLFHSFSNFSVPNNGSARFDLVNTPNITTIFSRVTGGNVSNIDGLIQTLNSNNAVSLFLMNPNGIVFGQNAQLDIGGSFVGTTANSIQFTDGTEFSAVNPTANPLLTMSVPVGLQMGSNPASIVVRGNGHNLRNGGSPFAVTGTHDEPQISVKPDNNIALIGGKITLDGGLVVAENSNIELGAIGVENNNSLVSLNTTGTSWTFNYDNIDNFSPIQILQRSLLDTGGTNPGNINLTGSTIDVLDASFALIENRGTGNSGNINVNASERLTVSGFVTNQDGRAFSTLANYTSASGDAGNVTIDAPQIYVRDRSEIRSTTVSSGNGGEITLRASEFIQLDNSIVDSEGIAQGNSVIFATAFSSGNAGVINIFTPQLNLLAGSQIGNTTFNAGNSNDININTQRLFLQDKAAITSSASRASGKGGNIIINVTESVEMIGSSRDSTESVVIGASSIAGTGNAGSITINTPRLSLQQGAFIQSSTLGDGDGGSITINASESVELSGSRLHTFFGIQPSTIRSVGILRPEATRRIFRLPNQVNGASGTVTVNAPRIRVTDGADISVGHDSVGNAGNLEINADSIFLDNQGQITANTASGNGGNIDLNLQKILQMRRGGLINTEAKGTGNGGNININSPVIAGLENSDIIANAFQGNGGKIDIITQGLFGLQFRDQLTPESDITASSQFGVSGTVEIKNFGIDPSSGLTELSVKLADSSDKIATACADTRGSSFVATGRGGIPQNPNQDIKSDRTWYDVRDISAYRKTGVVTAPIPTPPQALVQATGWRRNAQGQIEIFADKSPTDVQKPLTCAVVSR